MLRLSYSIDLVLTPPYHRPSRLNHIFKKQVTTIRSNIALAWGVTFSVFSSCDHDAMYLSFESIHFMFACGARQKTQMREPRISRT
jgi:hypothetical protein